MGDRRMSAPANNVPSIQIGEPFNPFALFAGIFIPESLVRSRAISAGPKLVYGRLARYAGRDGKCWPSVATLAQEIGLGKRQTQKYLAELEQEKLIRRINRFRDGAQTSNLFQFLWHPVFDTGVNDRSGEPVNDRSAEPVTNRSRKDGHSEDSQSEGDLDCPLTNRKKRDSRPAPLLPPSQCKSYPRLREAMANYMMDGPKSEMVYPTDRCVVEVMNAAKGASEDEAIQCLEHLRYECGFKPGTRSGPRHFSWFPTVVGDHFSRERVRRESANPMRGCEARDQSAARLNDEEFNELTAAI